MGRKHSKLESTFLRLSHLLRNAMILDTAVIAQFSISFQEFADSEVFLTVIRVNEWLLWIVTLGLSKLQWLFCLYSRSLLRRERADDFRKDRLMARKFV